MPWSNSSFYRIRFFKSWRAGEVNVLPREVVLSQNPNQVPTYFLIIITPEYYFTTVGVFVLQILVLLYYY